jgi:amino acid transporter
VLVSGLELLAKSGAVASVVGVALLIVFVVVLLVFPVEKNCDVNKCKYTSAAPAQLQPIFNQGFFALSLIVIAAGILMIRYSRWRESKATAKE